MSDASGLDILVVGTGVYVCGRSTDGYGTVLPAIYQWERSNDMNQLVVAGTRPESIETLQQKQSELGARHPASVQTEYYPTEDPDDQAYMRAAEELSEPCCAVVVIPDHLHADITSELISRDISTLVVKPLAPTVDEVDKLISLEQDHDVHCAVEFHKRFDRSNQLLRDTYRDGNLGDPLYFLVQYSQRKSVPEEHFSTWVEETNIFQYLAPHYVDIIRFVTGATPTTVSVSGQKQYLQANGYDTHDAIEVMLDWRTPDGNRFSSCFMMNWIDPESTSAMSDQRVTLVGTTGRHEADQKRRGIEVVTDDDGIWEPNPNFCQSYGKPSSASFRYEGYGIDSFRRFFSDAWQFASDTQAISNDDNRVVSFEEARISTAVIEAVNDCLAADQRSQTVSEYL